MTRRGNLLTVGNLEHAEIEQVLTCVATENLSDIFGHSPISRENWNVTTSFPNMQVISTRVRVSADNFGTGYSSLSSLQKVALDAIKIDRKIISEIAGNPDETTNASAIIKMGQSLNLRVIAEGVETTKDLEFLRTHRCDDAFGYYFGQPVPSGQFGEMSRAAKFLTARKSPEEATI